MKRYRVIILILLLLAVVVSATEAQSYTGALTSTADQSSGLNGTGLWATGVSIGWTVTWDGSNSWWHYSYTLSVPQRDISHFILEVSPNFGPSSIWNASLPLGTNAIADYTADNGNPGMPGTIHGIKFDQTSGLTLAISFDSDRMPVWGDFYAKDGVTGGVTNAVWNSGFTANDWDPNTPATSGSYNNHILVPDTATHYTPVPEPSSMIAGLALLSGVLGFKRRRS